MGSDNTHHADLTNFSGSASKREIYETILLSCEGLFFEQRNWVCNLANAASLLWHGYKTNTHDTKQNAVNWAGFYVLDPSNKDQLILGPFQGKVACQTIKIGNGVCGTAASTRETQLVRDVEKFPGHIACDGGTKSEIVVPIVLNDEAKTVVGVIDIDCEELEGFDEVDKEYLEKLAKVIADSCDW